MMITLMIALTLLYNIWTWSMKFIIRCPTNTEWNNIEWNQGGKEHQNANFPRSSLKQRIIQAVKW